MTISHVYQLPGTYSVSLTAASKSGKKTSEATSMMITITGSPVANFTMSDSIPAANGVVTFTSTSSNAEEYVWDFGDGNVPVTPGPVESHSYSMGGTYSVTLTVFAVNHTLSSTKTKLITVGGGSGNNVNLAMIIGTWSLTKKAVTDMRGTTTLTSFTSNNAGTSIGLNNMYSENSTNNTPNETDQFTCNGTIIKTDANGNYLANGSFSLLDAARMQFSGSYSIAYGEGGIPYATYVVTANSLVITFVSTNPTLQAYTDFSVTPNVNHPAGEKQVVTTIFTYSR